MASLVKCVTMICDACCPRKEERETAGGGVEIAGSEWASRKR